MKENKLRRLLAEPFGGLKNETLDELEVSVNKYTAKIIKYYQKNMFNGKLAGLTPDEIVEKFKRK